jgi:transcriptional antiterminator NusG
MAQEEIKPTEEEIAEEPIVEGSNEHSADAPEVHAADGDETNPVEVSEEHSEDAPEVHATAFDDAQPVEPAHEEPIAASPASDQPVLEGSPAEEPTEHTQPEVETAAPPAPEAAEPVVEADKHWYIIHTYSGFEQKVADSLKGRAQAFGFSDKIGNILIPTEEVVELRAGKKVTSKRLLYPGYVMVQMEMNDQLWHEVKNTPRVTGFVGGGNSPVPLTSDEVNSILYRQATSAERPRPKMNFEKNETVRINDGPFANFSGKIDEINPERNTLRVLVTIFGRATPVELDFLQVEKL